MREREREKEERERERKKRERDLYMYTGEHGRLIGCCNFAQYYYPLFYSKSLCSALHKILFLSPLLQSWYHGLLQFRHSTLVGAASLADIMAQVRYVHSRLVYCACESFHWIKKFATFVSVVMHTFLTSPCPTMSLMRFIST